MRRFVRLYGTVFIGRNASYTADELKQKFTQKERDAETGLDYFFARYYSSNQGRFTSVDPIDITDARLDDPQRLNLYVYARNNPLIFTDPDGRDVHLFMSNQPVGTAEIKLLGRDRRADAPERVIVPVYELRVTDDVTNKTSTYLVTRDAPIVGDSNLGMMSSMVVGVKNIAFEPKEDVGTYSLVAFDFPIKGIPSYAIKNPDGSDGLAAEPNGSPLRERPDIATSITIHVGGAYVGAGGVDSFAGSLGCFSLANESSGNRGANRLRDDINSRVAINRRAKKGTRLTLIIQKRRDVAWFWHVFPIAPKRDRRY
jgi:RHS repeat-associated protein